MRFFTPILLLFSAFTAAEHTYNLTRSLRSRDIQKYQCFDTAKANDVLPTCLHQCQIEANKADGCAYDDMACHCANHAAYSKLIHPCAFPATQGGNGTCTTADLMTAQPIIAEMCTFFNATLYASYSGCPQELSKEKTYALIGNNTIAARSENATRNYHNLDQRGTQHGWNYTRRDLEHDTQHGYNYTRRGMELNDTRHGLEQSDAQTRWNYTRRSVEQNYTQHSVEQRATPPGYNTTLPGLKQRSIHGLWNATKRAGGWNSTDDSA